MNSNHANTLANPAPKGKFNRTIPTQPYDPARLGRPYMARLTWDCTGAQDTHWYKWSGRDGKPGSFTADLQIGDILMAGQKSLSESIKSGPRYFQVQPNGTLLLLASRQIAQELYFANLAAEESHIPEAESRPLAHLTDLALKARYEEVLTEIRLRKTERSLP